MKTDDQRLQLVLDFANIPDIEEANQRELRSNLAEFLGYPLLADGEILPDLDDRWPINIGGTGFEVSAHIDLTGASMSKGYEVRDALAGFIGFGPPQEEVPFDVLRKLQDSTRGLIYDYLEDEDADRRRHATWVERGPGTEERRLAGKDSMSHVNKLADLEKLVEQLGGTIRAVGRGSTLRTHISGQPEVAFQWIVLLLIYGEPDIRICVRSKCQNFFVSNRSSKKYCSDRCGHAERNARQYADPEKRKRKNALRRARRASERR